MGRACASAILADDFTGACATPRYFKKIDSTFRGRIGVELEALMA